MLDAIAKALPTHIDRTGRRVGFARDRKLLRSLTIRLAEGDQTPLPVRHLADAEYCAKVRRHSLRTVNISLESVPGIER
jgi:hypothetical protein